MSTTSEATVVLPDSNTTTTTTTPNITTTSNKTTEGTETTTVTTPPPGSEDHTVMIVCVSVAAALILLIIFIIIVILWRRRKRREKPPVPMLPNPYPDRVLQRDQPERESTNVGTRLVVKFSKRKKSKKTSTSSHNGAPSGLDNPGQNVQQDETNDNYVNLTTGTSVDPQIGGSTYCTPTSELPGAVGIDPNRFDSEKYLKPRTFENQEVESHQRVHNKPSTSESLGSPDGQLKWTFTPRIIHMAESEDGDPYISMKQPKNRISLSPPTLPDPGLDMHNKASGKKSNSLRPPPPVCQVPNHKGYINLAADGQPLTQAEAGMIWSENDDFYENVKEMKRKVSPIPPIPIPVAEMQPLNGVSSDECESPTSPSSLNYVNVKRRSTDSGEYESPNALIGKPPLKRAGSTESTLSLEEQAQQGTYINTQSLPRQPQSTSTENLNINTSSDQSFQNGNKPKTKPKPKPLPKTVRAMKSLQSEHSDNNGSMFSTLPEIKPKPIPLRKSMSFDSSLDQIDQSLNTDMSKPPVKTPPQLPVNSKHRQANLSTRHEDEDENGTSENADEVNSYLAPVSQNPSSSSGYIASKKKFGGPGRKTSLGVPLKPPVAPKSSLLNMKKYGSVDTLGTVDLSELKSKLKRTS